MLHTDALRKKYGEVHAVIIRQNDAIRETKLVDSHGIMRTYAMIFFTGSHDSWLDVHSGIKAGGMVGETFRAHGYETVRKTIYRFTVSIPPWMQNDFQSWAKVAQAAIVKFYVNKSGEDPKRYGTIVEVYSPDFDDSADCNL